MKKLYENVDLKVLFFCSEDVLTSSADDSQDNVGDLIEFPEFMS